MQLKTVDLSEEKRQAGETLRNFGFQKDSPWAASLLAKSLRASKPCSKGRGETIGGRQPPGHSTIWDTRC